MKSKYLTIVLSMILAILLFFMIVSFIFLFSGCYKKPEIIIAVPKCDCKYEQDNPSNGCLGGEICDAFTPCAHTSSGLNDKCIPAELETKN